MASSKDSGLEFVAAVEDEDIRGDGKKKKFKPLSAMRKLFSGRSKRKKEENSVVAVKAKSTTALNSNFGDEGDDDGGFKAHTQVAVHTPLAGNRSISEDSVFSPEPRESYISVFPKSALSEESLPKSQFQSELLSKLNKRRSQYSDDDQDDGLPKSPVPLPVTAADVMGEHFKGVSPGKKTSNRDSEQSLISVDSSDNEEDNLFTSKWKQMVPAKKSNSRNSSTMSNDSETVVLDLNSIQKTEVLKSTAAKDRISIKPQARRASRQSRKKKDPSMSQSLPCLNEESSLKPRLESDDSEEKMDNEAGNQTNKQGKNADATAASSKSVSSVALLSSSSPGSNIHTELVLGSDGGKLSNAQKATTRAEVTRKDNSSVDKDMPATRSNIKSKTVGFETSAVSLQSSSAASPKSGQHGGAEGPSLKVSDPNSEVTMSPRGEEYKLRRQNRSKTMPMGGAEDQDNSSKVQRASSQRVHTSSPPVSPRAKEKQRCMSMASELPVAPAASVVKQEGSKFSKPENNSSSQPSWISMVRKKNEEKTGGSEGNEKESTNVTASAAKTSSASSDLPTENANVSVSSVKSISRSQDRKQAVKETTTSGQSDASKSGADVTEKDNNAKQQSTGSKRPSIDIGSLRRESIEIDKSELSSVRAMTNSFSSANKRNSVASRWTNPNSDDTKANVPTPSSPPQSSSPPFTKSSTAERAKRFSTASSSSSQAKPVGSSNNSKPPSGSISNTRFGSVKTSPTKSTKVSSSSFASPSIASTTSEPSSSQATNPPKLESQGVASKNAVVTSSSNVLGSSSNSVSSSRPPIHPNFSSSSSQSTPKVSSPTPSSSSSAPTSNVVKSFSFGVKSLSNAKTPASTSASASSSVHSSSSSSAPSTNVTTSSTSSSSSPSPSSSAAASFSTQPSQGKFPVRSHASFSASSAYRSQVPPSKPSPSSNSSISKSASMKTQVSPASKAEEKKTTTTTTTTTTTSSSSSSNVPAWRANLQKKDVKIEIIEKSVPSFSPSTPPSSSSLSSQNKTENGKKLGDNTRVAEITKVFQFRK